VQEQEEIAQHYYTTAQAAAHVGMNSQSGFVCWAQRVGITPARKTLDGVQDLYPKAEIDAVVAATQHLLRTCYTHQEATRVLGISKETLQNWVLQGRLACVHLPGKENYAGLYPKEEVQVLARERSVPRPQRAGTLMPVLALA
jgi:hypothetical protein